MSGACSKPCTPHTSIRSQSPKRNVPVTRPDGRKRTDCVSDTVHKKAGNWTAYSRKLVTKRPNVKLLYKELQSPPSKNHFPRSLFIMILDKRHSIWQRLRVSYDEE